MINLHKSDLADTLKLEQSGIKNIIFDLGGVIIDIRYNQTIEQFKKIGFSDFDTIYSQMKQSRIFDLLETGKIPAQTFRIELRKFHNHLTNAKIDKAWNAMIGEMSVQTLNLLKELRKNYRTFLLSNTNEIHIDYFIRYLKDKFGYNPLPEMFEHTYYSHEIGYRKPGIESFEFVMRDAGLKPIETLFIDDMEPNIKGAIEAGLHTYHLKNDLLISLHNS